MVKSLSWTNQHYRIHRWSHLGLACQVSRLSSMLSYFPRFWWTTLGFEMWFWCRARWCSSHDRLGWNLAGNGVSLMPVSLRGYLGVWWLTGQSGDGACLWGEGDGVGGLCFGSWGRLHLAFGCWIRVGWLLFGWSYVTWNTKFAVAGYFGWWCQLAQYSALQYRFLQRRRPSSTSFQIYPS